MVSDRDQFERTFADLAYASLKSRAPLLMEHLVGWQLVDASDDETRAIGIFGFKIGEQWLYKPVFFMNGEIKGTELLYLKGQDLFIPLQENWINYIVNRRPYVLGESEPFTLEQLGYQPPDFTQYAESPETKRASVDAIDQLASVCQEGWSKDAVRLVFSGDPNDPKYEKSAARLDLPTFFKEAGLEVFEAFVQAMQQDEKFASAVLKFYDLDDFRDIVPEHPRDVFSKSSQIRRGLKAEHGHKIEGTAPEVIVIDPGNNDPNVMKSLDDGEKEQLLRGEIVIRDHREETSEVFPADYHKVLQSPTENGVWDVLERDGRFNKLVVVNNPFRLKPNSRSQVMLIAPESGTVACVHPTSAFASKKYYDESWSEVWDGLPDARNVQKGQTVIFIGPKGNATAPIKILEVNRDTQGRTYLKAEDDYDMPIQGGKEYSGGHFQDLHPEYSPPPDSHGGVVTRTVVLGNVKSKRLRTAGSTLFVPDSFKMIRVSKQFDTAEQIDPGTMADLTMAISKTAAIVPIRVYDDGIHVHVSSRFGQRSPVTKMAALKSLIVDWGLKADDARGLLKQAADVSIRKEPVDAYIHLRNGHVKRAQGGYTTEMPPNYVGSYTTAPYSSQNPEYNRSFDALLGVEAQHPYVTNTEVRIPQDPPPLQPYKALADYGGSPMQDAAIAAQTGQKEVFDVSTVGRLTRMTDVAELVDKYLSDIVNGMDRIGRILFVFYWHYDKFADRYGKEDLPELEDSLKDSFKKLGDLVIFLRQKSIEPEVNIGLPLMAGVSE